ncbi:9616_t:CDS:2 [Funneliformis mosseae]|uniref:9616_t:CDS:1 n=1 Tax=Funneliformis mosseae TaxID=27381 RepID=A0A9N9HAB7_FUNMO|nr:9616_t:CDS:2 [Funneliformis mosseae]
MDRSSQKKSQRHILNKLKSWTKKLVAPSKATLKLKQPDCNNAKSQITHLSIENTSVELRINGGGSKRNSRNLIWSETITKSITNDASSDGGDKVLPTLEQPKPTTRRSSFFAISRLNSRLNSRISRVSAQQSLKRGSEVTTCTLPEFIEEPFDIDFIFNDFDQLNEIYELDESDEPYETDLSEDYLYEPTNQNDLSDLPDFPHVNEELDSYWEASLPYPTSLFSQYNTTLLYPSPTSESPLRGNVMEIECEINHSNLNVCEMCHSRLPGSSTRTSQYSATRNKSSIISDSYKNTLPLVKSQLTLLKIYDPDYITVKNMFYSEIPRAIIKAIIRLDMPTKLVKDHEKYKSKFAKLHGNKSVDDITFSMFHGTTTLFDCDPRRFADPNYCSLDNKVFCKKGCGMCGIIQHGNRKKFSKHGKKMWFAHSALISRDYTDSNSYTKVMFVIDIVAEEHNWILVVNRDKATLPRFMIIFE